MTLSSGINTKKMKYHVNDSQSRSKVRAQMVNKLVATMIFGTDVNDPLAITKALVTKDVCFCFGV